MTQDGQENQFDDEDAPIRKSRRTQKNNLQGIEKDEDHSAWVRRSSRRSKATSFSSHAPDSDGCLSDGTHQSTENGVRRSKRQHHKPSFYDPEAYEKHRTSTEEDEDDEEEEDEEEDEEEEEQDEEKGKSCVDIFLNHLLSK